MKPGLKHVLPRGAARAGRRKLSTATASAQPTPLYFDSGCPPPPSNSHGAGPSSPRLVKHSIHPGSPTTAITTYSPPTHSGQLIAHPRYTTNSSHAYPGSGLPLVWLVPASGKSKNDIERRMPWEGSAEGKGKERQAYRLEMGAYGIPKRRSMDTHEAHSSSSPGVAKEDSASFNLAVQVGEDAYFLRPDALGVADGVGGWKHKGESNSALFAKKLMHFCSWELAQASSPPYPTPPPTPPSASSHSPPSSDPDPIQILQSSYERCVREARESGLLGSSTATLAVLADSELRIAHVGDCVACVVRDGEIVFRSDEMQHSFNYPYQLGPKSATTPAAHAQRINVPVRPNDIVILASDGMGDNLWDEDVLDEVNRFIRPSASRSSPTSGPLSFAASSSSSFSPSTSPSSSSLFQAHATRGPVTNTVLAQRLSEALASRAKRVSERRAMSADASGTMGVFAARRSPNATSTARPIVTPSVAPSPRPASSSAPVVEKIQTPTPPPSPQLKATPVIEGIELPIHTRSSSITQSDGQLDEVLGDGFGGDGEYGGSGYRGAQAVKEEEEEEWVRDEIPFGRRAKEAGVRFVGGKGDDITVLVAIISGAPAAEPPSTAASSVTSDAVAKLRMNLHRPS